MAVVYPGASPAPGGQVPLVSSRELATWLQRDLDLDSAELAVRVAEGWLRRATSLATWPDPPGEVLWAACLELAGLAYDNPTSMSQRGTGNESDAWVITRRREILDGVTAEFAAAAGGGSPVGSFPPPQAWPA